MFSHLQELNLQSNRVADLTEFNKSDLPIIQSINLVGNPVVCLPVGSKLCPLRIYLQGGELSELSYQSVHRNV